MLRTDTPLAGILTRLNGSKVTIWADGHFHRGSSPSRIDWWR